MRNLDRSKRASITTSSRRRSYGTSNFYTPVSKKEEDFKDEILIEEIIQKNELEKQAQIKRQIEAEKTRKQALLASQIITDHHKSMTHTEIIEEKKKFIEQEKERNIERGKRIKEIFRNARNCKRLSLQKCAIKLEKLQKQEFDKQNRNKYAEESKNLKRILQTKNLSDDYRLRLTDRLHRLSQFYSTVVSESKN